MPSALSMAMALVFLPTFYPLDEAKELHSLSAGFASASSVPMVDVGYVLRPIRVFFGDKGLHVVH